MEYRGIWYGPSSHDNNSNNLKMVTDTASRHYLFVWQQLRIVRFAKSRQIALEELDQALDEHSSILPAVVDIVWPWEDNKSDTEVAILANKITSWARRRKGETAWVHTLEQYAAKGLKYPDPDPGRSNSTSQGKAQAELPSPGLEAGGGEGSAFASSSRHAHDAATPHPSTTRTKNSGELTRPPPKNRPTTSREPVTRAPPAPPSPPAPSSIDPAPQPPPSRSPSPPASKVPRRAPPPPPSARRDGGVSYEDDYEESFWRPIRSRQPSPQPALTVLTKTHTWSDKPNDTNIGPDRSSSMEANDNHATSGLSPTFPPEPSRSNSKSGTNKGDDDFRVGSSARTGKKSKRNMAGKEVEEGVSSRKDRNRKDDDHVATKSKKSNDRLGRNRHRTRMTAEGLEAELSEVDAALARMSMGGEGDFEVHFD